MGSGVNCEPKQETTNPTRQAGAPGIPFHHQTRPPRRPAASPDPPLKTRVWPPPWPPTTPVSPRRQGDGKRRGASERGGPRGRDTLNTPPPPLRHLRSARRRHRRRRARDCVRFQDVDQHICYFLHALGQC